VGPRPFGCGVKAGSSFECGRVFKEGKRFNTDATEGRRRTQRKATATAERRLPGSSRKRLDELAAPTSNAKTRRNLRLGKLGRSKQRP
jgi:hypothetical protein